MRGAGLVLFIVVSTGLCAQTKEEKAARKHREAIQKSAEKGTVILDLDTVYDAGVAYCVLKNEGSLFLPKYKGYALNGKEVLFADGAVVNNHWRFTFYDLDGRQADVPMDAAWPIAKIIVHHELIGADGLNEEKAGYFAMRYGEHREGVTPGGEIVEVKRNRSAMIFAFGNTLKQDGKEIATFESKSEMTKEYGSRRVFYIYFMNGTLCAKAIMHAGVMNQAAVTTQKDNKTSMITDAVLEVDDVAKYLVDNLYL